MSVLVDLVKRQPWSWYAILKKLDKTKRLIRPGLNSVYSETWLALGFILIHLIISPNRYYLFAISGFVLLLYRKMGDLAQSLWLTYIVAYPFVRGKFYDLVVVPKQLWSGPEDLVINVSILFSDVVLAGIVYLLITRKSAYRNVKLNSQYEVLGIVGLLLFVLASGVSVVFSEFQLASGFAFLQMVRLIVLFLVAKILLVDQVLFKKTLQVIFLFAMFSSILIIGQYLKGGPLGLLVEDNSSIQAVFKFADENPDLFRPGGFTTDPNTAGSYLALVYPLLLVRALAKRSKLFWLEAIALLLVVIAIVFTGSRFSGITVALITIASVWYLKKYHSFCLPGVAQKTGKFILVGLALVFLPLLVRRYATLVSAFSSEGGGTYRLAHLNVAGYYLVTKPVGVGVGMFKFTMATDFPVDITGLIPAPAHNLLAQVGAGTGVFGLGLFVGSLYFLLKDKLVGLAKNRSVKSFSIMMSLASYLLVSQAFPWLLRTPMPEVFWIFLGYNFKDKR